MYDVSNDYVTAIIAALALIIVAILTQILAHLYRLKQTVLDALRSRIVCNRIDAILDWGREVEISRHEIEKEEIVKRLEAAKKLYATVARAAHRQDKILGTNWRSCINQVHGIIEEVLKDSNMTSKKIREELITCDKIMTNLLDDVEWWRLFLLRNPMPNKLRVWLRKLVRW